VRGAPRRILVGDGRSEERHDPVPGVLHLGGDEREAAVDDSVDLLASRRAPHPRQNLAPDGLSVAQCAQLMA
jgi:hypothetical protein